MNRFSTTLISIAALRAGLPLQYLSVKFSVGRMEVKSKQMRDERRMLSLLDECCRSHQQKITPLQ